MIERSPIRPLSLGGRGLVGRQRVNNIEFDGPKAAGNPNSTDKFADFSGSVSPAAQKKQKQNPPDAGYQTPAESRAQLRRDDAALARQQWYAQPRSTLTAAQVAEDPANRPPPRVIRDFEDEVREELRRMTEDAARSGIDAADTLYRIGRHCPAASLPGEEHAGCPTVTERREALGAIVGLGRGGPNAPQRSAPAAKPAARGLLRGTQGNAGPVPESIASQLRGQGFSSPRAFRETFWKVVADDPDLAAQFGAGNIGRMRRGLAPFASREQQYGGHMRYVLHHRTPISRGGDPYDPANILVVSPRYHQEVLSPAYHFGRGG